MLVHICCSVDSHYFLSRLQKEAPQRELFSFFYNPNIHPYSEYSLRLMDVTRSCDMLRIPLIEGAYDYEYWLECATGLEDEPEKGKRCEICFETRFVETAKKARELGIKQFTSTLLMSPKKSMEQLCRAGERIAKEYGLEFVSYDFRKGGGSNAQNLLAKKDKLYRQNYCGCHFALKKQRAQQNRLDYELFCALQESLEPNSNEDKLKLYEKRMDLEVRKKPYEIVKNRFLNYRLLHAKLSDSKTKETIASFFLPYSTMKNPRSKGQVERIIDGVGYFNRDEVKLCSIEKFNSCARREFAGVSQLLQSRLDFDTLCKVRAELTHAHDLSCIIVVDTIPTQKLEITLDAHCFEDMKEELITDVKA